MLLSRWRVTSYPTARQHLLSALFLQQAPSKGRRLGIMSFTTAKDVQDTRNRYRSDSLEMELHKSMNKDAVSSNGTPSGRARERSASKLSTKSVVTIESQGSSDEDVVPDSEPDRQASWISQASKYRALKVASLDQTRIAETTDDKATSPRREIIELLSSQPELLDKGDSSSESGIELVDSLPAGQAKRPVLDKYKYEPNHPIEGIKRPSFPVAGGKGKGPISRSVSTVSSSSTSIPGLPQNEPGPSVPKTSVTKDQAAPKEKKEKKKKEPEILPPYPVSDSEMKKLEGCVVCETKWVGRQFLKTKWVSR
jgi:hypothetical protein